MKLREFCESNTFRTRYFCKISLLKFYKIEQKFILEMVKFSVSFDMRLE